MHMIVVFIDAQGMASEQIDVHHIPNVVLTFFGIKFFVRGKVLQFVLGWGKKLHHVVFSVARRRIVDCQLQSLNVSYFLILGCDLSIFLKRKKTQNHFELRKQSLAPYADGPTVNLRIGQIGPDICMRKTARRLTKRKKATHSKIIKNVSLC